MDPDEVESLRLAGPLKVRNHLASHALRLGRAERQVGRQGLLHLGAHVGRGIAAATQGQAAGKEAQCLL